MAILIIQESEKVLQVNSIKKSNYDYNLSFNNIEDNMFDSILIIIEWNIF